jgi:Uncharacterized protein conserved in bacteria
MLLCRSRKEIIVRSALFTLLLIAAVGPSQPALAQSGKSEPQRSGATKTGVTFTEAEIEKAGSEFLGVGAREFAQAVERVFADLGRPIGYIAGAETAGSFGVGLRYGEGELIMKSGARRDVYWQGPSVGFDVGGNASRVFTLVYDLRTLDDIYKRYPGVEGTGYFVAGIGVNYQQRPEATLVPMRVGVGLRAGANIGYLKYSRKKRLTPF